MPHAGKVLTAMRALSVLCVPSTAAATATANRLRPVRRLGLVVGACAAGVLALAAAAGADTPPGGTVLAPTMFETFQGPSATIKLDFHADCSSTGTKYVVADAYNEDGKQVASSGTVFHLDGPLSLTVTIDNGSWTEEFVLQVTLHCGKDIVPAGQTEVTVTDGKRQAEIAVEHWKQVSDAWTKRSKSVCSGPDSLPGACLAYSVSIQYAETMRMMSEAAVEDPPDARFGVVALPKPRPAPRLSGPNTAPLNRLTATLVKLEALGKALVASIDRAGGARKAGDRAGLHTQRDAAALYARQTASLTRSLPALVRQASSAAVTAPSGPAREIGRAHVLSIFGSPAFAATLQATIVTLQQIGGR